MLDSQPLLARDARTTPHGTARSHRHCVCTVGASVLCRCVAAALQGLQTVISRNLAPVEAGVVSTTFVHGGSAYNIIPGALGCSRDVAEISRGLGEVQPRCSRGAAEVQPRCSRGVAEMSPRCRRGSRDTARLATGRVELGGTIRSLSKEGCASDLPTAGQGGGAVSGVSSHLSRGQVQSCLWQGREAAL